MRRVMFLLAMIIPLALVAPAAPAAPKPARVDWRTVVDFTGSGLDPYSAADAALLQTLEPQRMRDPIRRAQLTRQLSTLTDAQAKLPKAQRTQIASPAGVQSIDPGCQLTSSNPGGYDLCGYDSSPDVMSRWSHPGCGSQNDREHHMWVAVQETDTPDPTFGWHQYRGWWKSRALGCNGTDVDHTIDPIGFEIWHAQGSDTTGAILYGPVDQAIDNCLPLCYGTGAWHPQVAGSKYGSKIVRDYVEIHGTSDTSSTNNEHYSMWWDRNGCACSSYPGPNDYVR